MVPEKERSSKKQARVKVFDARPEDVGRGIARLDPDTAEKLDLIPGKTVLVSGKNRSTAVRLKEGHPEDRNKGIIRLDALTRSNAGAFIDNEVTVRETGVEPAKWITLAPKEPLRISGGELFLKRILENRTVVKGDTIEVPVMNRKLILKVMRHVPASAAVTVTKMTEIMISDRVARDAGEEHVTPVAFLKALEKEIGAFFGRYPTLPAGSLHKGKALPERLREGACRFTTAHGRIQGGKIADDGEAVKYSVFEEIIRCLTRLSQRTYQEHVPLIDLMDDMEDHEKTAFYRLMLAEIGDKVQLPFKYYPSSGIFEKDNKVADWGMAIENAKIVLEGKCPNCNAKLTGEQVKAFENGEELKCRNCEQFIENGWEASCW